jgi:type IV secretory pathway VirB10-like protein
MPPASRTARIAALGSVLAALVLATWAPSAQAQWRWRDARGQINVSDRPPPKEIPEKDILSRPTLQVQARAAAAAAPALPASGASAPAAAGAAASGTPLQAEVEARRRRAEQEQAARSKAEEERLAAQRAENCRRARAHVAALEGGQRVARVNERGEREVLDDKGRADEMRQAREVIASDCR